MNVEIYHADPNNEGNKLQMQAKKNFYISKVEQNDYILNLQGVVEKGNNNNVRLVNLSPDIQYTIDGCLEPNMRNC